MIGRRTGARTLALSALDELDDRSWDAAVSGSGAPFRFSHRAAAGRAFEAALASYRFMPCRAEYSDGSVALFPLVQVERRLAATSMLLGMPLGLEGTPIALAGAPAPAHVRALFTALEPCGTLQLSGGAGGSPPPAGAVGTAATHVLELGRGFAAIWREAFTDKTRNMCRKAERAGVSVTRETGEAALADYYELYTRRSVEWGYAAPPYPRELLSALLGSPDAELWIGRIGDDAVAGALLLRGSDDVLYWSGAMDRERRAAAPSNAVVRTAIEAACERGARYFDFGSSGDNAGVAAFKRSFGATPRQYRTVALSTRRYRQLQRLQDLRRSRGAEPRRP